MRRRISYCIFFPILAVSLAGAAAAQSEGEKQKTKENAQFEKLKAYQRGKLALDRRNYDAASQYFNMARKAGGERADGAMYWEAYALTQQAEMMKAQAVLESLAAEHPESRWRDDAQVLTYFIQQSAGSTPDPEMAEDEELKLYAINSLANSAPERAVPLLKKIIEEPNHPKLKERALFVLAMTNDGESLPVVESIARGGGNPDLQLKAIEYLGHLRSENAGTVLAEVYASGDAEVKRAVLRSYIGLGETDQLVRAAKTESDSAIAGEAIRSLGILKESDVLMEIYQGTDSTELRMEVIHALVLSGDAKALIGLARNESDPELRNDAIKRLGMSRDEEATKTLIELYPSGDKDVRREVLRALFIQQNAPALVSLARSEEDVELKKYAVKHLSHMNSPEAVEYMMELLGQ